MAIRRGRPLRDPKVADLAVEAAARRYPAAVSRRTQLRRAAAIVAVAALAGALTLVAAFAGSGVDAPTLALGSALVAVAGWQLRRRRLVARAVKAEAANRDVAERASAWAVYARRSTPLG